MKNQTWAPAEDEDQRVQEHASVHHAEGSSLLVAQVTVGRHGPPVNVSCFYHEPLVQEKRFTSSEAGSYQQLLF